MATNEHKTVAMRLLDQAKIAYGTHPLPVEEPRSAVEVAAMLGVAPEQVFKTLVTTGKSGKHYVFMLPGSAELDLKKAALAAGEKSVEMLPASELYRLTGYVHGGCSPVGMKKRLRTFIDHSAEGCEAIYFSAGKLGLQLSMPLTSFHQFMPIELADVARLT